MGFYVGDKAVRKILEGENSDVGHISTKNKGVYPKKEGETAEFNYTGADQHWTAPESGKLTIECWGAGAISSAGGYAKGTIQVLKGDKFFIVCGSHGNSGGTYGFNGTSNYSSAYNGGGLSGVFTGEETVTDSSAARALVIGGGAGGAGKYGAGGVGGGENGGDGGAGGGLGGPGYGGTQTAKGGGAQRGGQFQGGGPSGTYGSGGGGGWYGGGGNTGDRSSWDDQSAGGGSGYVIASATDRVLTQGGGSNTSTAGKVVLTFLREPKITPAQYVTEAGAYHNPDLGLISISSDGENWITMSDKDVGAQDVLEAGKTFQYGNAYGFPGAGDSSQIATDDTTPDLTGYEGGNLYSNDHYRTNADWNAANRNLWKGIAFNLKSLERGPCPRGFHIPSLAEIQAAMQAAGSVAGVGTNVTYEVLNQYLLLSHYSSRQGSGEFYPKTTYYLTNEYDDNQSQNMVKALRIYGDEGSETIGILSAYMNYGCYIRPFRDKAIVPTTGWTRLGPGEEQSIVETYLGFDNNTEVTEKGFAFGTYDKSGVGCNGTLYVIGGNNDSGGSVIRSVAGLKKWKAQCRLYVTGTSRGGDQHFACGDGDFSGNLRDGNNPGHHLSMTTSSSYRGYSGIGTGTSQGQEYGYGGFSGRYVYEIEYDNGTYTMTRYNDTSEVTEDSPYTHRKTFTGLGEAGNVGVWIRYGSSSENYNVADRFKFFY